MVRPQRLLFEGTSTDKYYAYITDFNIGVSLVAVLASALTRNFGISVSLVVVLASALIRNVGISVLTVNLSGKARRAAATDAKRARVQVEMV